MPPRVYIPSSNWEREIHAAVSVSSSSVRQQRVQMELGHDVSPSRWIAMFLLSYSRVGLHSRGLKLKWVLDAWCRYGLWLQDCLIKNGRNWKSCQLSMRSVLSFSFFFFQFSGFWSCFGYVPHTIIMCVWTMKYSISHSSSSPTHLRKRRLGRSESDEGFIRSMLDNEVWVSCLIRFLHFNRRC